jgi:hypothetical protein
MALHGRPGGFCCAQHTNERTADQPRSPSTARVDQRVRKKGARVRWARWARRRALPACNGAEKKGREADRWVIFGGSVCSEAPERKCCTWYSEMYEYCGILRTNL